MRFLSSLLVGSCALLLLGSANAQIPVKWQYVDRWVCSEKDPAVVRAALMASHNSQGANGFELVSVVHVPGTTPDNYCMYAVYKRRAP